MQHIVSILMMFIIDIIISIWWFPCQYYKFSCFTCLIGVSQKVAMKSAFGYVRLLSIVQCLQRFECEGQKRNLGSGLCCICGNLDGISCLLISFTSQHMTRRWSVFINFIFCGIRYIYFECRLSHTLLNINGWSPVVSINMICISTSHIILSASDVNYSVY